MENNNQITITGYEDIKKEIKNSIGKVVVSFVEIGYYLKKIRDEKLYLEDGYKDIWEMAKAEYNLERTVTSRFMSINDRYSVDGNSLKLQEQFTGFGKSALTEMLTLPVEDYELITPDTKIEDIRQLKEAEKEQVEGIPGQMSLVKDMPDVVPEADKPKEDVSISKAIRELFRPREMKEYLDRLVNMDPDSSAMEWWVADFNQSGNRVFKHIPFFLFFYSKEEGIKVKNIKTGIIETRTYKEFYFMTRVAFPKETASGTDVWMQAFGEEWEEQQRQEKEAEEKAKQQSHQKEQDKKQKNGDFPKRESDSEKPKKEPQTTENRSEITENRSEITENRSGITENCSKITENDTEAEAETVDFTQREADSQEQPEKEVEEDSKEIVTGEVEKPVCDTAQGFTVHFPAKLGEKIYKIMPCPMDENGNYKYGIRDIVPYLYEVRIEVTMYYHEVASGKSGEVIYFETVDISKLKDNDIYVDREEAERRLEELNGTEE